MLIVFISLILISAAALKIADFYRNSVKTADFGGEYVEGIVGQPRYINPVLAPANEIDSDLCELIFSGLFKYSADGKIIEDAAENIEISEDKKTYSIKLKENILWHDQEKLTAEDVCFTAQIISDPAYGSPLRESLQSVECRAEEEHKIRFILKESYAPFLHNLTFKILPRHIWESTPPAKFPLTERNLKPVGSGPFSLKKISKDPDGFIHCATLEKFENYFSQKPFLQNITFRFYENDDALLEAYNKKEILGISKLPENWRDRMQTPENLNLFKIQPLQYFGIFFNQSQDKALQEKNVRTALSLALNKDAIVNEIFGETAEKIDNIPLPGSASVLPQNYDEAISKANSLLSESGWNDPDGDGIREKNGEKLEFSVSAINHPQFAETAEILKNSWREIGANISLDIKSSPEMNSLIENREYSALIFGQVLGANPDPYAFWHSSQKNHPGLNLSLFASAEADKLLEQIRLSENPEENSELFKNFQNILSNEVPAIFLFRPVRFFAINKKIMGIELKEISSSSSRFSGLEKWHINTKYERRN